MKSLDLVAKGKINIVFLGDDLFFGRVWVVHVLPMQPPLSLSSVSITAPLHFRDMYWMEDESTTVGVKLTLAHTDPPGTTSPSVMSQVNSNPVNGTQSVSSESVKEVVTWDKQRDIERENRVRALRNWHRYVDAYCCDSHWRGVEDFKGFLWTFANGDRAKWQHWITLFFNTWNS